MATYAAFLRGIGPGDPRMSNENLRRVLEELGFRDVRTYLSSGNLVFRADETDIAKLEARIEQAWPDKLGFSSTTIVRSQQQLEELVAHDPFAGLAHSRSSYLLVTFFQKPTKLPFALPYHPEDRSFYFPAGDQNTLFSVSDMTHSKGAEIMPWLEKQFGTQITSRTWQTVQRVLKMIS